MRLKFIISVLAMAVSAFALSLYLPWWILAPCCMLVALLMPLKPILAFASGFLSMFLYWGGMAALISTANHHLLAAKMGKLMFQSENPLFPIMVAAFIAGLLGALSALAGSIFTYRKPRS
jgi:hypothetical protein